MSTPAPASGGAPAMPPTDPTSMAAPGAPDDSSSGGFKICLMVDGSGKMSVSVDTDGSGSDPTSGTAPGGDDDMGDAQPVGSLAEAFKLIREIVAHAGQMASPQASADDMSAGYGPAGQ